MAVLRDLLERLGVQSCSDALLVDSSRQRCHGETFVIRSPIDGQLLAEIPSASSDDLNAAILSAEEAFLEWRQVPAPARGELVRRFGEILRRHKVDLAYLVTLESGKILQEALGEVQEMIDICDFATGLSRQLYGLTIATERARHRMMEQWHPLGPVGVITAFNFPVAVWAWNAAIALVCGNPVIWKPSEKTPLCAMACHSLLMTAADEMADVAGALEVPNGLSSVVIGGRGHRQSDGGRPSNSNDFCHGKCGDGQDGRPDRFYATRPVPARTGRQQCLHCCAVR
jgi:aldehyde dehydrogenase (NAD+)